MLIDTGLAAATDLDELGWPRWLVDLNPSNRPVRNRMPFGFAGDARDLCADLDVLGDLGPMGAILRSARRERARSVHVCAR